MNIENLALVIENITGADPLRSTRARPVVDARTLLVNVLLSSGWTERQVADAIGYSHPNVHHHRQLLRDAIKYGNNPSVLSGWKQLQKIYDI